MDALRIYGKPKSEAEFNCRLICKQRVSGSNPLVGSRPKIVFRNWPSSPLYPEKDVALDLVSQPYDLLPSPFEENAGQLSIRCEFERHRLAIELSVPATEEPLLQTTDHLIQTLGPPGALRLDRRNPCDLPTPSTLPQQLAVQPFVRSHSKVSKDLEGAAARLGPAPFLPSTQLAAPHRTPIFSSNGSALVVSVSCCSRPTTATSDCSHSCHHAFADSSNVRPRRIRQ